MTEDLEKTRHRCPSSRLVAGLGVLLVATTLASCATPSPEEEWQHRLRQAGIERPDVILITIDTLRADRLSSYSADGVATPAIDSLATDGVRFAHAASTVPFTLPAHSSIMTGTYPPFHGVRENVGYTLGEEIPTLAEVLRDAGYVTAGFVSAFVLDAQWGIARGFDTFFDEFHPEEFEGPNLGLVQRDGRETVTQAVQWLAERPDGPLFLWLHLFDPHDPYEPAEPYRSRYPGRPYEAEVAYTDSLIADFLQALEAQGLDDTGLVILTGDHGEGLGQHREASHGYYIYDSTTRIPLIIRTPFDGTAGTVVDTPVSHVDLFPTVLAATGVSPPPDLQGSSLLPDLLGLEPAADREVYTESMYALLHYGWAPLKSLRSGRYKFIDSPRPELFDLVEDPGEERNLVRRERQIAEQLRRRLEALTAELESAAAADTGGPAEIDEAALRQLQALGYLAGRGVAAAADDDSVDRADPKDKIELHQAMMAAQTRFSHDDAEAAADLLEQVLERDPDIVDAHQMLGKIRAQAGEPEPAARHFQRVLELDPDHRESVLGLARAYRDLGRDDDAMVGYEQLLRTDPGDPRAAGDASEILVGRGDVAGAIRTLSAATAGDTPSPHLFNQLGELLVQEGRGEEAETAFRTAIEGGEKLAQPRFNLAVMLEERGELREAADLYEEAIERAPRHFEAQFNLGRLYGHMGRPELHLELWEAAVESNPNFARGHFLLAKLIMDRGGDLERAEELARRGLERDPPGRTGALGHFVLADILNRQGRGTEARKEVRLGQKLQSAQAD